MFIFNRKSKQIKALKEYNRRLIECNQNLENKNNTLNNRVNKLLKINKSLRKQIEDLKGYW